MHYIRSFHCFHGTTTNRFDEIVKDRKFIFKQRKNHWLGNGVYFFLDDREKAAWWAKTISRRERAVPCIVYINGNAASNEVLDLNTESGQGILQGFIEFLKSQKIAIKVPENNLSEDEQEHYFRCIVMDLLTIEKGYKASCYLFPNSSKPYMFDDLMSYGIMNNKGNQLCVYDQSILDFNSLEKSVVR